MTSMATANRATAQHAWHVDGPHTPDWWTDCRLSGDKPSVGSWPSAGGRERQLPGRELSGTEVQSSDSFRQPRTSAMGRVLTASCGLAVTGDAQNADVRALGCQLTRGAGSRATLADVRLGRRRIRE